MMTLIRRRTFSALTDGLLVLCVSLFFVFLGTRNIFSLQTPVGFFSWELPLAAFIVILLPSIIFKSTLGKKAANLKLLKEPGFLGYIKLAGKYSVLVVCAMLPFYPYLLVMMIVFSAYFSGGKRNILDKVFGTKVVRN